jgi:hypothetical glycosyl hydrolase
MKWTEKGFSLEKLNKYGTLFTVGNGALGVRGVFEEDYPEQVRGMFRAGIYNTPAGSTSAELVNLPDITRCKITLDGDVFSMQNENTTHFELFLDVKTGEFVRRLEWQSPQNRRYMLEFRRFASKKVQSLVAAKISVTPLSGDMEMKVETGIDGQQTNFGTQQLVELEARVFGSNQMFAHYQTTESKQNVAILTTLSADAVFYAKNRQLMGELSFTCKKNETVIFEKMTYVLTLLDHETPAGAILLLPNENYEAVLKPSIQKWNDFWNQAGIRIESQNEMDQKLVSFALYHLEIMSPKNDSRLSIGAKGLTGEGYKGHVFWDTEIFLLPFILHHSPEEAKNLLLYRFQHLEGAEKKARENGYKGALFPWESAFSGDEETPEFAAINIKTGKRQKVASALAEHHIVADIAYAVMQYFNATNDAAFMKQYGAKLLRMTAEFWLSRAERLGEKWVIRDVIGPDEYTEHIDNNAYTNYMAHYNVAVAAKWNADFAPSCAEFLEKLYLPKPNENGIIPQDDTFLSKPVISLEKYKKEQGKQGILLDYARSEVNEMQILKQADIVMLMYLFPALFDADIMKKNLVFYETRTIHDSSLSKAIHAIIANWCNEKALSYRFFEEACRIDFGDAPHTSDDGIHAASLGAIWLMVINGFAGLTVTQKGLKLNPQLPDKWEKVQFNFVYLGETLHFTLTKRDISIRKSSDTPIHFNIFGKKYIVEKEIHVNLEEVPL